MSPYGLLQEQLSQDPWKIFVCCIFCNLTKRVQAEPYFWEVLKRWPTPQKLSSANSDILIKLPENSFYLLPTRIWELLAGSIIAIIKLNELKAPYKNKIYKNNLVILGYILIFSSFLFFSDKISHPSIFTLIPIAGISIILYFEVKNEDQSWLGRLFNNYAAQKIGLIS